MLLNKSHYNKKCNNYFEDHNNFESQTKSLDIFSQWALAVPHRKEKVNIN